MDKGLRDRLQEWEHISFVPVLRDRFGIMAWRLICIGTPENFTIQKAKWHIEHCRKLITINPNNQAYYQWQIDAIQGAIDRKEIAIGKTEAE